MGPTDSILILMWLKFQNWGTTLLREFNVEFVAFSKYVLSIATLLQIIELQSET